MEFRFEKRITIFPSLKAHVGFSGISTALGASASSINMGRKGISGNLALLHRSKQPVLHSKDTSFTKEAQITLKLDKENGSVVFLNNEGEEITGKKRDTLFCTQAEFIQAWLQNQAREINGEIALLLNIFLDSPHIDSLPVYKLSPYSKPVPCKPQKLEYRSKPSKDAVSNINMLFYCFSHDRAKYQAQQAKADIKYQQALQSWQQDCKRIDQQYEKKILSYQQAYLAWQKMKQVYEEQQKQINASFRALLTFDIELMEQQLANMLEQMKWAKETQVNFQITNQGRSIWLDVSLLRLEEFPQKIAIIAQDGRRLRIKKKSVKQLQQEYSYHIHGIGLRLACFVLATLPIAEQVIISGYTKCCHGITGHNHDRFLISTKFTRTGLRKINFQQLADINPIKIHALFEHKINICSTGYLQAIDPFAMEKNISRANLG